MWWWWPSSLSFPRRGGCREAGVLGRPVCIDACPILSFRAVVVVVPPACPTRKQSLAAAVAIAVAGAAAVVVPHRPVLVLVLSLLSSLAHPVHPTSSCSQQRLAVVVVVLSFPSCCCSSRDLSPCRLSVPSSTNDPPCEQLLAAVLAGVGSLIYVEVVSSDVAGIRGVAGAYLVVTHSWHLPGVVLYKNEPGVRAACVVVVHRNLSVRKTLHKTLWRLWWWSRSHLQRG
jgi:hypothetical protein